MEKRIVAYRINNTQARQSGGHLWLAERVRLVFVKVPERALELLQLRWCQIRHIP